MSSTNWADICFEIKVSLFRVHELPWKILSGLAVISGKFILYLPKLWNVPWLRCERRRCHGMELICGSSLTTREAFAFCVLNESKTITFKSFKFLVCNLKDGHKSWVLTSETILETSENVRFNRVVHKTMIHNIFKNFREARQDWESSIIGGFLCQRSCTLE